MLQTRFQAPPLPGEADLSYDHGDFRIRKQGSFVRCAVTGKSIPLDELRYWSVERQEPYASPEAALKRLREIKAPTVYGR
jgi:hypothetical protein